MIVTNKELLVFEELVGVYGHSSEIWFDRLPSASYCLIALRQWMDRPTTNEDTFLLRCLA